MPAPTALLHGYLLLLLLERLVELWLSERNRHRALVAGGAEAGRRHYPAMVLFHVAFLVACAAEPVRCPRDWPYPLALAALGLALLAMALRWWAIATLGERWSTRIMTWPGRPLVTSGPYRHLRHPNYLAVALELLAVPLIGGAVYTAAAAAVGNVLLLSVRIPAEERALAAGLGPGPTPDRGPVGDP